MAYLLTLVFKPLKRARRATIPELNKKTLVFNSSMLLLRAGVESRGPARPAGGADIMGLDRLIHSPNHKVMPLSFIAR